MQNVFRIPIQYTALGFLLYVLIVLYILLKHFLEFGLGQKIWISTFIFSKKLSPIPHPVLTSSHLCPTLTNPNWRAFLFKWRIFNANDYLYESFLLKSRIALKMSTIYSIPNKCDWKNKSDLIVIFILTSDKSYIYRTLQKHKKKSRFI